MLTLTHFTKILLLTTSFLLLTGCNDNKENTETTSMQTSQTISPQVPSSSADTNGLKSLVLTVDKTTLNKDENTTVKVMASYEDGTSKEVTDKVEWIVTPEGSIIVTKRILTARKDNQTTLQVKLGNVLSNSKNLDITWVVNGHTLPPEPDKALNDSTLLGIDVNGNGVRDDVERWIYEEYKDKHPIHIDIAMQAARGYKFVLETPERAKEIREVVSAAQTCNWYYWKDAKYLNEKLLVNERIDSKVFSKYFNSAERQRVYWQYDKLLSGGVYDLPKIADEKSFCDFDTSIYDEE